YGTTRGPDITGAAVPALLAILQSIAPVLEPTRDWALETYGPSRSLTAMELARAVTEAGAGQPPDRRLQQIREAGMRSFEAVSECRYVSAEDVRRLLAAQRTLAEASVAAAARGTAVDAVRELASQHGEVARVATDAWLAWRLHGAPKPDTTIINELIPAFEDLLLTAELTATTSRPATVRNAFH